MDITLENKDGLERQINVTIPAEEVSRLFNERYEHLGKTAKIQGFRPGHVPMQVIKQRFTDQVREEITQHLVTSSLDRALSEKKVVPVTQPHVHKGEPAEEGKPYAYHAHFEVLPSVEPKDYKGLKLTRPTAEISDKEINEVLERLKDARQEFTEKKGKAEKGDRLTVDTKGYVDGAKEPYPGTDLKNHQVVLGTNSLIPGFEEELEGLEAGAEKAFDITFPKKYHSNELAGKKARFEVKVSKVESPVEAKVDDKFAENFGEKSLEGLKKRIREQLEHDTKEAGEQHLRKEMFDALDKANQFDVPAGLVESEFQNIWHMQMQNLQQQGLSPEILGKNEDEMRAECRNIADRRVRLGLLLSEISKKEKIEVSDAEVQAEIDRMAQQYGDQAEQARAHFSKPENRGQVYGPLFEKKVVNWILENSTVTDKKTSAEELMKEE